MSKRIVVGIDHSEGSSAAVRWAAEYASEISAKSVTAVFAVASPVSWIDVGSGEEERMLAATRERAEKQIHEQLVDIRQEFASVEIETAFIVGEPAAVLIDASATADLLVVGSRGRGRFKGALLGSVSQRAAEHAHCPVTIVRSAN